MWLNKRDYKKISSDVFISELTLYYSMISKTEDTMSNSRRHRTYGDSCSGGYGCGDGRCGERAACGGGFSNGNVFVGLGEITVALMVSFLVLVVVVWRR